MDPLMLPSRQSAVTLQDITADNWGRITRLVVNKDQLSLVTPNLESLCEHQFYQPRSIVRAVYADIVPVGFIRLQQDLKQDQDQKQQEKNSSSSTTMLLLKNFMIDQSCQGLGFGTKALLALQKELFNHPKQQPYIGIRISTLLFATAHQEDSPAHFFTELGFERSHDPSSHDLVWFPAP